MQIFWKTYVTPGVLTLVALTMVFITAGVSMGCVLCVCARVGAPLRPSMRAQAQARCVFCDYSYFLFVRLLLAVESSSPQAL